MSKRTGTRKIKDPAEASALALEWFNQENKPVTVQSLTDALGSRVPKPLVQRTLEALLSEGKIQAKDLKKVRFFYLKVAATEEAPAEAAGGAVDGNPNDDGEGDEEERGASSPIRDRAGKEDDAMIAEDGDAEQHGDTEATERETIIAAIVGCARPYQEAERALAAAMNVPTAAERAARLHNLRADLDQLRSEVAAAEVRAAAAVTTQDDGNSLPNTALSAATTLDDVVYSYKKARSLWKERREYADRLIDGVLGDAFSKRELSDIFGLTTDADVGVSFAASAMHLPPSLASPVAIRHTGLDAD